jgi:hypothetical protein
VYCTPRKRLPTSRVDGQIIWGVKVHPHRTRKTFSDRDPSNDVSLKLFSGLWSYPRRAMAHKAHVRRSGFNENFGMGLGTELASAESRRRRSALACLSSPRARAPLLGSSCRKSVNYRLWLDAHIITCIAFSSIETEHKCETLFYLRWSLETWILENISSTTRSIGATWFQQFWSFDLNQRTRSVISIVCHQPCHIFRLVSPPFSIATHGPSMVSFSPR